MTMPRCSDKRSTASFWICFMSASWFHFCISKHPAQRTSRPFQLSKTRLKSKYSFLYGKFCSLEAKSLNTSASDFCRIKEANTKVTFSRMYSLLKSQMPHLERQFQFPPNGLKIHRKMSLFSKEGEIDTTRARTHLAPVFWLKAQCKVNQESALIWWFTNWMKRGGAPLSRIKYRWKQ